ncbi:MAG: hypothetical protein PUC39_05380 [Lachnospiraceae bacterium]|nr:hypothetical protein [Lachnospiraceae bacterium]
MSVTPVTLQMTIPMTNDMAQVQNNENMRANTEHMQFANAAEKQTKVNRETVIQKDSTEFPEYRYDAREKGSNEYQGNGGRKRKGKTEEVLSEDQDSGKSKEKKKHVVQIDIKL